MKTAFKILFLLAAVAALNGCATSDDEYRDEKEYSDMPWNTPQQWEGSRSIPGMGGGGQGY
jgi:hypothetical protein